MGYPAKSYELFKRLGEILEGENKYPANEITQLLKKYSIQSFFVYDPLKEPDFAKMLEDDFMFFDRLTGGKMMFMCLLEPSEKHHGAMYRYYDFFKEDSWVGTKPASQVADISLATQLLCTELDLNYKYSPYLVFTTDFRNDWAYILELNTSNLEKTMRDISMIAQRLITGSHRKSLDEAIFLIAPKLAENLIVRKYSTSLTKKMMYFLENTDIEITKRKYRNGISRDFFRQNNFLRKSIYFESEGIHALDTRYFSGGQIDAIYQQIAGNITLIKKNLEFEYLNFNQKSISDSEDQFYPTSLKKMEVNKECYSENKSLVGKFMNRFFKKETEIIFDQVGNYKVCTDNFEVYSKNLVKICKGIIDIGFDLKNQLDYSFMTVNLAKIFETEINHSIGQVVRQNDNIEMPEYYYKLKPDGDIHPYIPDNLNIPNPRAIPLNKPLDRIHWLPPGMGETRMVWNSMQVKQPALKDLFPGNSLAMLDKGWRTIHLIRNKTSHTQPVTRSDYTSLMETFEEFSKQTVFKDMMNLKTKMNTT